MKALWNYLFIFVPKILWSPAGFLAVTAPCQGGRMVWAEACRLLAWKQTSLLMFRTPGNQDQEITIWHLVLLLAATHNWDLERWHFPSSAVENPVRLLMQEVCAKALPEATQQQNIIRHNYHTKTVIFQQIVFTYSSKTIQMKIYFKILRSGMVFLAEEQGLSSECLHGLPSKPSSATSGTDFTSEELFTT